MGDVISLPARPRIVDNYTAVKSDGIFSSMSVTLARIVTTELASLALVLDGRPDGVGFEILGRIHNTSEGIALADYMAHAVTIALMHVCEPA